MSESIPCPLCGGDGTLDCAGGCPGDDRSCLTCNGDGPFACHCGTGVIEKPAFCALCYEGELCASAKPEPEWLPHPRLAAELLTWLYRRGRLDLDECERSFCATCKTLVGEVVL